MIKKLDSNVGATHLRQINPFLVSAEEQSVVKYKPRIWGDIETTEDFMYVIDVLETAKEQDTVELHVCSGGGDVDATMTLVHAMQKCEAHVHVIMTGTCASCGTIPMFYGDSWECGEFTSFMFHDFILGLPAQTMSATKAMGEHHYKICENILRGIYKGFFTEEELVLLLNGKQYWFTPDQVAERYNTRMEILEKQEKSDEGDKDNDEEPSSCCKGADCNCGAGD